MRQHFVTFTCDRCGKKEDRPGKSDGNYPPGWLAIDGADLCENDARQWTDADFAFRTAFMANIPLEDIFASDTLTHTKIDAELEELDPETHPEEHDA